MCERERVNSAEGDDRATASRQERHLGAVLVGDVLHGEVPDAALRRAATLATAAQVLRGGPRGEGGQEEEARGTHEVEVDRRGGENLNRQSN